MRLVKLVLFPFQQCFSIGLLKMISSGNDCQCMAKTMRSGAKLLVPALAMVALSILSSAAAAGEVARFNLVAGRKYSLFSSGQIDPTTCKTIDTINYRPDVVREPAHGTLSVGLEQRPFNSISGSSPCNGKPYLANILYYQPAKGFKGVDTFVLRKTVLAHFREMTEEVTVEVTVK